MLDEIIPTYFVETLLMHDALVAYVKNREIIQVGTILYVAKSQYNE